MYNITILMVRNSYKLRAEKILVRSIIMDYRKIFDHNVSPEDFDKWRTH